MSISRESDEPSIVLLGDFDPRKFHPAQLALFGLIPKEDAENAKFPSPTLSPMEYTLSWAIVQVFQNRVLAKASDSLHLTALSDLVSGALSLQDGAKVTALGLNCLLRYKVSDAASWHALGDSLVPKGPWLSAGLQPEISDRREPGLFAVQVQGRRPESSAQFLRVALRPEPDLRIVIDLNEHFETDLSGSIKIIREQWDAAQHYFATLADHLVGAA